MRIDAVELGGVLRKEELKQTPDAHVAEAFLAADGSGQDAKFRFSFGLASRLRLLVQLILIPLVLFILSLTRSEGLSHFLIPLFITQLSHGVQTRL